MTTPGPYGASLGEVEPTRIPLFWAKVRRGEGCWEWTAALDNGGYGLFNTQGRPAKAHRVSWVLANGPLAAGLLVLHRCDNRKCVRPDHLYLGTQRQNVADMDSRGRRARGYTLASIHRGEQHQAARLSDATIAAIRAEMAAGGKQRHVAAKYGCSHTYVGMLVRGEKRALRPTQEEVR